MRIEQVPIERDRLGEGAFWDARIGCLYWLDHLAPSVRRYEPATATHSAWMLPKMGGCACLTDDPDILVVALADAFALLDLRTGLCREVATVPQSRVAIRLSDGHADRGGNFVVGSAVTDFGGQDGAIFRLNADLSVETLMPGMMLSNAICFSPDGGRMHYTDTRSGIVMSVDYDPAKPLLSRPVEFGDAREHGASPDGATVDAQGGVWVAQIRTGDIVRFAADGSFDRKFSMPVPHATSVAWGGAGLDVLYVTTVRDTGMQIKSDHPQAGGLFEVHGLGFVGVEEGYFTLAQGAVLQEVQ